MLPRNKKLRFHRLNGESMNRRARPRLGGLTLSFYSMAVFMMICGGQVSVSHSAPIPRHWHASSRFIPREVQSDQPFTSFEMNMREAAGANSQHAADQGILSGLKRMIADLAHAKNELVLALLALPLVLYFVGLAWIASSRRENKGKSKKQKLQHFGHKGIFKPYLITLGTGMLSGSGCKSDVIMKLCGTSGSTPYYNLSRMSRESGWLNPCRRGAQSGFVIWTRNIGELTAVQIQLDNKHIQENPKWLLDFVRVTDCQEETQQTWLVNKLLRGAGPHILIVRSAQLQPVVRYMAVNMLRGFSRLSVWNVWTLLQEDTNLGAVSSLSLCLLIIVSQMALSSILLYLLPDQMPNFASSDTLLQTLDTYGVGLSHKNILLQLAAGTVVGTALLWVLETILRYASKKRSSGLTKNHLKHIRKAIKLSKDEEERMFGKNEAVKKMQINIKPNVPKEPLLIADKGVKGEVVPSKDIDKKSDGYENPEKISSGGVPTRWDKEILNPTKNTPFPNKDQASKNVQEAVDGSKNAFQTTSNAKKVEKQDPKGNLNGPTQDQQSPNAKLEELSTSGSKSTGRPVSLEQSPSGSKSTGHSVLPEQSPSGTKSTGRPHLLEQSLSGFKSTGLPVSLEQSLSGNRSTGQPVSPELSVSTCKSTDAKAARASSSMDDAAIIPITPNTSVTTTKAPDEREILEAYRAICKQQGIIRKKSHKPGKKRRANENQNCSTGKVRIRAPNELFFMELVMEEEEKADGMLNVGDLLVKQDYVDQALLTIENQRAGTTPTNLPVLVTYITYVLITLLCLLAVGATVLFGAALSPHKAAMWLVYTVTGLVWHMLVLEPLKVLVVVFYFSMRRKFY